MKRLILGISLLAAAIPALADGGGCITGPAISQHKALHALGTGTLAFAGTAVTGDWRVGAALGAAAGVAREIEKVDGTGTRCEWSSIAWDALGIAIGASAAQHWVVVPRRDGATVAFFSTF